MPIPSTGMPSTGIPSTGMPSVGIQSLQFNRVMLTNLPTGLYRRDDRCQSLVEDQTVKVVFAPIDLGWIAANLRKSNIDVMIRDYPAMSSKTAWTYYLKDLQEFQPQLIVANVVTASLDADCHALETAKQMLGSDVFTAARGESLERLGIQVLSKHPGIDFCLFGEIETLLLSLCIGEPLDSLPGLSWRSSAGIVQNPGRPRIEDLDILPDPAYDLLDLKLYKSPESGHPMMVIQGHRGCPSKCIFCPAGAISGYRVRYRSPERVFGDICYCSRELGIREFLFHGDTFTLNRKWLIELCGLIIEAKLPIRWGCNARVDTFDEIRAERMKQAGCWVVAFGIESGSQLILDHLHKGQRVDQARQAIHIAKRHGLKTHAFYIIGTPWETEETLKQTQSLARELDTDFFDFNLATPLSGTPFYDLVVKEHLFNPNSSTQHSYASSTIRSYTLSARALTAWRRKILLKLYLRPHYILKILLGAGSVKKIGYYFYAGIQRLIHLIFH